MQYKAHRKYHRQTPTDYNTKTVSVYTAKKRKNKRCQQFSTARTKHNRTSGVFLLHNRMVDGIKGFGVIDRNAPDLRA